MPGVMSVVGRDGATYFYTLDSRICGKNKEDDSKSECTSDQEDAFSDLTLLRSFYEPASLPSSPEFDKASTCSLSSDTEKSINDVNENKTRRLSLPSFTPLMPLGQCDSAWAYHAESSNHIDWPIPVGK